MVQPVPSPEHRPADSTESSGGAVLSLQAIENERNPGSIFRRTDTPESKLRRAAGVLNLQFDVLKELRQVADLELRPAP